MPDKAASDIAWPHPSPPPVQPVVEPGQDQVVVVSPAGTRAVVDRAAVTSLKTQGYKEASGKAARVELAADAPDRSATKQVWVEYAVANGVPSFEAANLSKDDLIKRLGG